MVARDEVGQSVHPALGVQGGHLRIRPVPFHPLLDQHMAVGQGGDLGGMGDAEDLVAAAGTLTQHLADLPGRLARNAAVDLVVDDGGHGVPVGQGILDGQGDAAQFASGCDFGQGFGRFAGVGGDIKFDAVLPVAGQRPTAVPQAEPDPRHIQEIQCIRDLAVEFLKSLQAGLGQDLGGFPGQTVQPHLFGLQTVVVLLGELDALQLFPGLFPKGQHIFHRVAVFPLELVDQVQPLLDLVQFPVVALVILQAGSQVGREILGGVVEIQQLARAVRQAAVQLGCGIDGVGRFPQQVHSAGGLVPARQGRIGPGDLFPDGGGVGQHLAAALQALLLSCGQGGVVDLVHLVLQQVGLAALLFLVGDQAVQFPLDPDQLLVDLVIGLVLGPVLGIIVQQGLVMGRVEQPHRVVLAVDIDQAPAQFPQ